MATALAGPALFLQVSPVRAPGCKQCAAPAGCGVKAAAPRTATRASTSDNAACSTAVTLTRRDAALSGAVGFFLAVALPAVADELEDVYKQETQEVIEQVRSTLALEKADPNKPVAVQLLKKASNTWVAKYRREKKVAGKPSFSNMYSVLNAISGHYISFGPTYPIPAKRKERILEELQIAEKALTRGR